MTIRLHQLDGIMLEWNVDSESFIIRGKVSD
jgi:hypothetical protein